MQHVESEFLMECWSHCGVNACSGKLDCRVRKPEGSIRSEGCRTKGVISPELPHTRAKLGKTTVEECHGNGNTACFIGKKAGIGAGEDESCKGEGTKAKRSGISNYWCYDSRPFCCNLSH